MLDFNNIWVDFSCPVCQYEDEVQLIDAKNEIEVYCSNCKSSIQLKDDEASVNNTIESINNALDDLNNMFKKFGK